MIKIVNVSFIILLVYFMSVSVQSGKNDKPCKCNWTNDWAPVCASDGKTFSHKINLKCYNKCNKANVRILHTGVCPRIQPPGNLLS
ncbi:PREDICTED: turripeptide Ici9.2-like [Ceratosolen solmsi marchali]|uniref:Turripeptide Ici9.2-like n=1 Tax=Ceratosolen solmsi marchali TaxID=326594 RepID=A0AAJ6VM99_9HYME|nr:PREDICTED: turripeptide Ici9.2-like [Ceratosolen solmsi marchali]